VKKLKNRFFFHLICQIFSAVLFLGYASQGISSDQKIYVIPVSGDVEPGMASFIQRALQDVPEGEIAVLEVDTFGGRVDSALKIVDLIVDTPKIKTIAYVSKKAISAGALIALSCDELVMKRNTTIGDCAPITFSKEGPKMMGEKFQSPLRAKFRALAKKNGYPEALAESMVTPDMEVLEVKMAEKTVYMDSVDFEDLSPLQKKKVLSKKTVVKKGELLTMDDSEASLLGFSKMSVANIDEFIRKIGIEGYQIIKIEQKWSETLSRFINSIASVLLLVGLAALYIELKAPGFGAPGIIGIVCLALVFLNQYIVGLADYTELIAIAIGLVLLGFELFVIPGFGIAGIAGFIFIAVGMILAFQDFVIPKPEFPWEADLLVGNVTQVLGSFLAAFVMSMLFLRYVFPRFSNVIKGPYLSASLTDARADSMEAREATVGDTGVAMTFLRPSGKARIGNAMFDVITDGEFMEKGTPVVITDIKGNRLMVSRNIGYES